MAEPLKLPVDRRFRRGLYVMLVTIGVLAASGFIAAQQQHGEYLDQKKQNQRLQTAVAELASNQVKLLQMQAAESAASAQRSAAAAAERQRLLQRDQQLEQFILVLLEKNGTVPVGKFTVAGTPSPSSGSHPHASAAPTTSPRPQPRPSGSGAPSPTPIITPTCIDVTKLHLCVGRLFRAATR